MQITHVSIRIPESTYNKNDYRANLRAILSVEFDGELVVHGIKLIEGKKGMFLSMPSEMKADRCPECYGKTHVVANYCQRCGAKLEENRARYLAPDERGHVKLGMDIAHPVVTALRDKILEACINEYYWATNEKANDRRAV